MNRITIIGNATKDPDYSVSANGTPVCKMTVAVNRRVEDKTDYFRLSAFKQLAELCASYVVKGKKIAVVGSMQFGEYTDKDGIKRTTADLIANEVEFLPPKEEKNPATLKKVTQTEMDDLPF